jgi:villidin, putative
MLGMSAYALNEVARLSRTGSWVVRLLAMGPEAQDEENARVEGWICERMRQEGLYVGEAERIVRQVWPLYLERVAFRKWLRRHRGVNISVPETAGWAADMGAMDLMYVGRDALVAARLFLEMMDRGEAVPFEYRKDPVTEVPEEVRREQERIKAEREEESERRERKMREAERKYKEAVEKMGEILREYGRMKENGESGVLEDSGEEKLTEEQEAKLEKLMERELTEEEIDSAEGFHEIIKNYAKGYLRGIKSAISTVAYKLIKERVRRKEVREKF